MAIVGGGRRGCSDVFRAWAGKGLQRSFSCVVSLSRKKHAGGERDAATGVALGAGGGGDTLRGRGSPRGNLSHRAGTFRIDLLEGFPNSFPNIAPRVAACLRRVPFTALSSSRGTTATPPPAMPSSREKTRRVCGLPRKTRVEAEGPRAGASRRCPPLVSGFK